LRSHAPRAEASAWQDGVFVGCRGNGLLPSAARLAQLALERWTRHFNAAISERCVVEDFLRKEVSRRISLVHGSKRGVRSPR
jgi:hypothetical protein